MINKSVADVVNVNEHNKRTIKMLHMWTEYHNVFKLELIYE